MDSHFLQELEELKTKLLHMAALTRDALEKAIRALQERDDSLAHEVIQEDRAINRMEVELDGLGLRLLALEQPVARDLRFVMGSLRITVDLERIADQAVSIAENALLLNAKPPLPINPSLLMLADTTLEMYREAVASFIHMDDERARRVCRSDDTADGLNLQVLKTLLDHMIHESPAIERSVHTIITSRCLERAADLATNIAESVIFIHQGVSIKHYGV